MNKIIFVGGAAGVGKSTICKKLAEMDRKIINLKFFKCISDEGLMLSKAEQLERWDELQVSLVKNQIVPLIKTDKNIVFDTHYSFQRKGGSDIAFAKRSFDSSIPTELTYCSEFAISLTKLKISLALILLKAGANEIQLRQTKDSGSFLTIETIKKEQETEEKSWKDFTNLLQNTGLEIVSQIVDNTKSAKLTASKLLKSISEVVLKNG